MRQIAPSFIAAVIAIMASAQLSIAVAADIKFDNYTTVTVTKSFQATLREPDGDENASGTRIRYGEQCGIPDGSKLVYAGDYGDDVIVRVLPKVTQTSSVRRCPGGAAVTVSRLVYTDLFYGDFEATREWFRRTLATLQKR